MYVYDIRKPGRPLSASSLHRRPISAIDWLKFVPSLSLFLSLSFSDKNDSGERLVTQSNDETLKLWSVENGVVDCTEPIRTFKGFVRREGEGKEKENGRS